MNEKCDGEEYFKNKGYKVTILEELPVKPSYLVEKKGIKKTVDVINLDGKVKSISQFVYDRIMSGGFFVILPSFARWGTHKLKVYTKDDIERVAKTYRIMWKDKVK